MKKIIALALSLIMILSLSVSAFAANIDSVTPDTNKDSAVVSGAFDAAEDVEEVYSIDVAWGSMEFTYHAFQAAQGWDPDTHDFDVDEIDAYWSCVADANKITVTNHSNVAIVATLVAEMVDGITECGFYDAAEAGEAVTALNIGSAVGTEKVNAPADDAYFIITAGAIEADSENIGTIKVTITKAQ